MKKLSALLAASVVSAAVFAQCTVNPLANLTVLSPMPTDPLPDGFVGQAYQGSGLSISFAASGQNIDPAVLVALFNINLPVPAGTATFAVTRVQVQNVSGLPGGITAVSPDNPTEWNQGESGCFRVSGTPTAAGDFQITFDMLVDIKYTITLTGTTGTFTPPQAVPVPYQMRVRNDMSIDEFGAKGLSLFPNPAGDVFTVSYPATQTDLANIQITDMSGKTVASMSKTINSNGGNLSVDINGLANGMYRVSFNAGNVHTATKLVVQK